MAEAQASSPTPPSVGMAGPSRFSSRSHSPIPPKNWSRWTDATLMSVSSVTRKGPLESGLPSFPSEALFLGHVRRLGDRWLNLDVGPVNCRQLTGSLRLQKPGIIRILKLLARVRIL